MLDRYYYRRTGRTTVVFARAIADLIEYGVCFLTDHPEGEKASDRSYMHRFFDALNGFLVGDFNREDYIVKTIDTHKVCVFVNPESTIMTAISKRVQLGYTSMPQWVTDFWVEYSYKYWTVKGKKPTRIIKNKDKWEILKDRIKKLLESVKEKLCCKAGEIKAYGNAVIELLDENDQESCVSPEERLLRGEFTFEYGKLDFVCHTQNVEFEEVLAAITAMRDECQRQIDSQNKCPHFKG